MEYNNIVQMPITELLECYNVLNSACICYESELKPLFGTQIPNEQAKWSYINTNFQIAKKYRDIVLMAMLVAFFDLYQLYVKKQKKQKVKFIKRNNLHKETKWKRNKSLFGIVFVV